MDEQPRTRPLGEAEAIVLCREFGGEAVGEHRDIGQSSSSTRDSERTDGIGQRFPYGGLWQVWTSLRTPTSSTGGVLG